MNTSRRSFTVAAAFIVFARTVLTARGAPLESPAAIPERKSEPTERTRDLAKAVLAASRNDATVSALNEIMARAWLVSLQRAIPNAKPEWLPVMESVIQEETKDVMDVMNQMSIEIYATKFTDSQLLDMLVFYRTEGGRALVAQSPAILREKSEFGRKIAAERLPRLVAATCAKVGCPDPAQKRNTP
jgi:hypothetical protein